MIHIITNNQPRNLVYGYELSEKERKDFDYIEPENFDSYDFCRYKGNVYDLSEFITLHDPISQKTFPGWSGAQGDTYFSGILVKLIPDNTDQVIMGRYYQ